MALGLNSKCHDRLKQLLAEKLADTEVDNGIFLDVKSAWGLRVAADKVLPTRGKVHDKVQEYIGEHPLFCFVYDTLSRDLSKSGSYSSEKAATPLQNLPNYTDLEAVAGRLVDDFESLPWSYLISFELPKSVGEPIRTAMGSYPLTSSLRVVTPNENYDSVYPMPPGIEEMGGGLAAAFFRGISTLRWNKETAYIQIDTEGFIGSYLKTQPLEEAIGTLKSFIGLSLATRLMKMREEGTPLAFEAPLKSRLIIHRKSGDDWQLWSTPELPSDLSTALNRLEIDDVQGQIKTEEVSGRIQNSLPVISTAFKNPDKAERVLLAAQWLLDSYIGSNELLSFVQTTVAMEIMLGEESDVIGIGELLRNRCAYLIGKTYRQREEILENFKRIYDIRSRIVHRGKSRLNIDELFLFRHLQWMCRRVICEEIELIGKDKKDAG